jgi:hypothetical protein
LTARRLRDGSFLLLFFNNGWHGYSPPKNNTRNPYWLSRGERNDAGDDIVWSEPEVTLYEFSRHCTLYSYTMHCTHTLCTVLVSIYKSSQYTNHLIIRRLRCMDVGGMSMMVTQRTI